ncbi:MAG TPA: glycoside hydrolase family 2 [Verrucomicrobiae bacterium]|nr:glycoside hydrolase family 2 [Verrucomicrobiae bacterium]
MKPFLAFFFIGLLLATSKADVIAQANETVSSVADGDISLSGGNWKIDNAMFVHGTPAQISQAGYVDNNWNPAVVPGTVLTSYLTFFPDPWYGDQMNQISDAFFSTNDFWYRCQFMIPADDAGKHIWLNFDGINWKADIFLNGTAVGNIDGAFIRGRFDITSTARPGTTNYLAVLIHHVAHPESGPGKVIHKKLGSRTTNGDLLGYDSPTFLASAGWNWLPIVPGREIGIWNDVRVETTGDVKLIDPWVITDLPLPKTNRADLTVKTELLNNTDHSERGELIGQIGKMTFHQEEALEPGQTKSVTLDKFDCPQLSIKNPRLWWPNDYGSQPLYTLKLRFEIGGRISASRSVHFGIRKISYVRNNAIDSTNPMLTLYVNGRRILIRGGNWGMDDGMLNCNTAGYDLRVRLHHDANLNMIRNWVGMVGNEAFYDACDRYGILIWDDFWLANPVDGPDPTDDGMFIANMRDKIRRVRSHPSLALYCGRNEGLPPHELDMAMRAATRELDGTRYYIPHSAAGAVTGYGPYDDRNPEWYFANRGKALHSELGIVAVPSVESMRAMMPATNLWPINDMWAVHDYQSPRSDNYTKRIIQRYGAPSGIEDYCRKAQLVNMETAKAMFECLRANRGSGELIWMTQSAWPALICQLYDYYFEPTAAYFGAKQGAKPLHIFWDSNADTVKTANDTLNDETDLTAEARAYDLDGKEMWRKSTALDLPLGSVKSCFAIQRPADPSAVFFIKLKLRRGKKVLDENFYWSSSKNGSCTNLDKLPRVILPVTATRAGDSQTSRLMVHVSNPTPHVALMIRLKVVRANSGERVLPAFYEDNYFSLLPGEDRTLSVRFATADLAGEQPKLAVEGWNVRPEEVSIQ